jgi:hypothetical protein
MTELKKIRNPKKRDHPFATGVDGQGHEASQICRTNPSPQIQLSEFNQSNAFDLSVLLFLATFAKCPYEVEKPAV